MTDRRVVELVVLILGLVTLAALGLIGYLAIVEKPIPDALVTASAGGMGAVAGLLARTSSTPPEPPAAEALDVAEAE